MAKEKDKCMCGMDKCDCRCRKMTGGGSGMVYVAGVVGSMVYFLQGVTTFWLGVLAVLKAFVWPALLVYKLLQFLG